MEKDHNLSNEDVLRYSRQIILPELGPQGQEKLKNGKVLIVGAGGLGCPAAIYLAGAGVGTMGIVDFDLVDHTNLHRQVLHCESEVGTSKSCSIVEAVYRLNSSIKCTPFNCLLSSENALDLVEDYDVVVDCTDNVSTRYLINDACVLRKKPLVSGSALRFEGQLTVYNCPTSDLDDSGNKIYGPCYRCIFPEPPPASSVTNCSEGGVLGPVVGVIGSMQALEVIKILSGIGGSFVQKLFLFDGLNGVTRTVKLRGKMDNCAVCGKDPSVTALIDYPTFCGSGACDKDKPVELLEPKDRISVESYKGISSDTKRSHLLVDVRPETEFNIGRLKRSINIPFSRIKRSEPRQLFDALACEALEDGVREVFVICRRGNDSQHAVLMLREKLSSIAEAAHIDLKDVSGGLEDWSRIIDPAFPKY